MFWELKNTFKKGTRDRKKPPLPGAPYGPEVGASGLQAGHLQLDFCSHFLRKEAGGL